MNYKAIIFDMNGTLLRDSELHETAWIEIAKQIREKPLTINEFQLNGHGLTNKGIVTYLLGTEPDKNLLYEIVEAKEGMYRKMCLDNKESFILAPDVEKFLNKVKENNIPTTIATGSYLTNVEFYFDHLHLYKWFNIDDIILDDGTYKGKPEPFVYEKAAAILKATPKECIVFEDSYSGLKAANTAGIGRIFAVEPQLDKERVKQIGNIYKMIDGFAGLRIEDVLG